LREFAAAELTFEPIVLDDVPLAASRTASEDDRGRESSGVADPEPIEGSFDLAPGLRLGAEPGRVVGDFLHFNPLARDPKDAGVVYAVFSLMPYAEVWRMAIDGGNLLARIDPISLAGGLSFCVLVLIGGSLAARHLSRRRAAPR